MPLNDWHHQIAQQNVILVGLLFSLNSCDKKTTDEYLLTTNLIGLGSGSVTSEPEGIDCGATCEASFDEGSKITLTAKEENEVLLARLAQLQNEISGYREALIENRRLRQLLDVKKQQEGYKTVLANVIGCDISPWRAVVVIDKGKMDGLAADMPVLSQAGVIGRVIEVGMSCSRVMLVTDFQSRIAAIIQRNRARGLLTGRGREGCSLEYVEKGVDVESGDIVITSGLDAVFPKGLLLGEVVSVKASDHSNLFQDIKVRPFSDASRVEEVLVLLTVFPEEAKKKSSPAK